MKLNVQLKNELKKVESLFKPVAEIPKKDPDPIPVSNPKPGIVVGGEILWKPVDKTASLLLSKPPWWAYLNEGAKKKEPEKTKSETNNKKRGRKHMKGTFTEKVMAVEAGHSTPENGNYTSARGLPVVMKNGEAFCETEHFALVIHQELLKILEETRPGVLAAQDCRKVLNELLSGIDGDMERFNASTKQHLQDIRQTRFAVVSETAAMSKELRDIRQFFIGKDYLDEVNRLREFVDLCERLHKLKQSGFLDSVADTMLRLAP